MATRHEEGASNANRGRQRIWRLKTIERFRQTFKPYCRILGLATEYSTSVRKFTATYVKPIARMQPCTR